jgi:response regulator RpfG family c-di-GMP phosphodiesterase
MKSPQTSPSHPAAARILAVDDTPECLESLVPLLLHRGYEVQTAENGEAALLAVRENPPEIVLLDINMPDLSGYQVAERMKQDSRSGEIPIIFLSSLEDADAKVRAFASGGVDYVVKPFEFAEVEARIKTHLKLRRLQVELAERNQEYRQANEELLRIEQTRNDLAFAANFGTLWTYYKQFDGQFLGPECRQAALEFLANFEAQMGQDAEKRTALTRPPLDRIAAELRAWAIESEETSASTDRLTLTDILLLLTLYPARFGEPIQSSRRKHREADPSRRGAKIGKLCEMARPLSAHENND